MCGIVGYVGRTNDGTALDVVMEGLARLEYRGYDSAGVALLDVGIGHWIYRRAKSLGLGTEMPFGDDAASSAR